MCLVIFVLYIGPEHAGWTPSRAQPISHSHQKCRLLTLIEVSLSLDLIFATSYARKREIKDFLNLTRSLESFEDACEGSSITQFKCFFGLWCPFAEKDGLEWKFRR